MRLLFHEIFDIEYAKYSGHLTIPEKIRPFKLSLLLESSIDVDGTGGNITRNFAQ